MSEQKIHLDNIFDREDRASFYKGLLDDMVTFVAVLDPNGTVLFVNNTPLLMAGLTLSDVLGEKFWKAYWWVYSDKAIEQIRADVESCAAGENINHEIQVLTEDGTLIWIEFSMHPIFDEAGNVEYVIPEGRDVTNRKQQEEMLRRSMKMDSLGKLTAGIAHDYNNILSIIGGYAELISERVKGDSELEKYIEDIQNATNRGAKLSHKLLSFTRQKVSQVSTCDINDKLIDLQLMIEKTLTSKIRLVYELKDNLSKVDLDANDLEDCIVNICINAMHAMESGGQLSIRTDTVSLSSSDVEQLDVDAGSFVSLSFIDTGCGMDEATVDKIFDPFFSTKGECGTGLGMSQVHGFIQRVNGMIKIFSQHNYGTRVVLYFPVSDKPLNLKHTAELNPKKLKGNESILVVDDEVAIAELAQNILSSHDYCVHVASNGEQALSILKEHTVDLMITDVLMPNMSGYELAATAQQRYPAMKIQVVSGFDDDLNTNTYHAELRENIIYKPFTAKRLLGHIRAHFDVECSGDKKIV